MLKRNKKEIKNKSSVKKTPSSRMVVKTALSIKARELKKKRIKEASQLKGGYLGKLSYELRTPLNSIIGFTELIKSEKPGTINHEQEEYLEDILLSARHLLEIISDNSNSSKTNRRHK